MCLSLTSYLPVNHPTRITSQEPTYQYRSTYPNLVPSGLPTIRRTGSVCVTSAFVGTDPTNKWIISGLPVIIWEQSLLLVASEHALAT